MIPSVEEPLLALRHKLHSPSKIRVGINGFGRIGRSIFRVALLQSDLEVVAINHTCRSAHDVLHLIRYDSTHGCLSKTRVADFDVLDPQTLRIDGRHIALFSQRDPARLSWDTAGADYVVECTGKLTTLAQASLHISEAGAKRVFISAPSADAPTFVYGVNLDRFDSSTKVVSCASCTTNCLAPIVKILDEEYGLEQGLMTTVHASTQSQQVLDGYSMRDRRAGRSVLGNVIPTTTGAAQAISKVLPRVAGRLTGISLRVPITNVSLVDLTVNLKTATTLPSLLNKLRHASKTYLNGVLQVCDEELVSCDFLGNPHSAIIDVKMCLELNSNFYKIVAWYDNEWGYSSRLLDIVRFVAGKDVC